MNAYYKVMGNLYKFAVVWFVLAGIPASEGSDISITGTGPNLFPQQTVITDCLATGYYCVYNTELDGSQTITRDISNISFTLKASFLFGGRGIAMQGTGKKAPDGDYIKYTGGGGGFVRIAGPDAGKNLEGRWVISPDALRSRYARLGITNFAGFGNLALLSPDEANYSLVSSITGVMGQTLQPWRSISVDPSLIPLGQTVTLLFKIDAPENYKPAHTVFKAQDIGGMIKGKHIEIYLGEGQAAIDQWNRSGGNRYVDIYLL
jgi:3D (Asp-Asp-Asp) domain-containing protein